MRKVKLSRKLRVIKDAQSHLKSFKHEARGASLQSQTIYQRKRLASFQPDFSIQSESVQRLARAIHVFEKIEQETGQKQKDIG